VDVTGVNTIELVAKSIGSDNAPVAVAWGDAHLQN
jgi:hypothetical protein